MEYVEGYDLAKMVKAKGPLPVAHACYFIHQAALGLQHAHEHGMVHRDIKPANLILAREGKKAIVKVLDFGLAKVTSEGQTDSGLTREGQMLGTPDYIAPEQIRDAQSADIRADIYSLGCTLYYLLTGGPPFRGDSLWDLYQAHFSMDAGPLNLVRPEVPVELAALVAKMMAKEPARRFQEPREVAEALKPFFKAENLRTIGSDSQTTQAESTGMGRPEDATILPASARATVAGTQAVRAQKVVEPTAPEARGDDLIQVSETEGSSDAMNLEPAAGGRRRRRPPWLTWPRIAAASLFGLIALGIIIIIYITSDKPDAKITVDQNTGRIQVELQPEDSARLLLKQSDPTSPSRAAPGNESAAAGSGWVPLLNRKDLTGWVVDGGDDKAWEVQSGEIAVRSPDEFSGGMGYLLTDRDYENFDLRLQFQQSSDAATSGIALRAVPHETVRNSNPDAEGRWVFHLTVWIGKYPPWINGDGDRTGALYWSPVDRVSPPLGPDQRAEIKPVPEWNDMEIKMRGQSLRVAVNGRGVLDVMLNKDRPEKFLAPGLNRYAGRIGLLKRTGGMRFRNIEIRELREPGRKDVRPSPPTTALPQSFTNSLGMKLVLIPAGEFMMGSPDSDRTAAPAERPQHRVIISEAFYLGMFEVTQGQYRAVIGENPSGFKGSDDLPVEQISWTDSVKYCNKLSERSGRKPYYSIQGDQVTIGGGNGYRLPTEAEWEYACRAGTSTRYPAGDDAGTLGEFASYAPNSEKKTRAVGQKRANAWGLHDMLGNVWEWCADCYDEKYYASPPQVNPPGAGPASQHVLRGGGWDCDPGWCRIAISDFPLTRGSAETTPASAWPWSPPVAMLSFGLQRPRLASRRNPPTPKHSKKIVERRSPCSSLVAPSRFA